MEWTNIIHRTAAILLGLAPVLGYCQRPVQLRVAVDTAQAVRTMQGGIGASWHAIQEQLPGRRPGLGAYAGSAWGANPPAEDEKAWRALYRHANWLGLDWCRVELEQRMYEPRRRDFSWDNREMRALYRILDWAEENGVDVFLQQMWSNVDWNAFPELRHDPVGRLRSGPLSLDDFAYGLGELAEHLVRRKGYKCIRWLSITNEPGHQGFSWWQAGDLTPLPIAPGLAAVRKELDRRAISLPLAGPDWTDLPVLDPSQIDFDESIGAYDVHSYHAVFDSMTHGYTLSEAQRRLQRWAAWAHARHKPFFLSELGTMGFGWGNEDPGPASYEAGLKDASLVVRGINAGVDAFNRWSFVNRGDLDGQWQLVDTWNVDEGRFLEEFRPRPNAYFQYGLLTRFAAKHSTILRTEVEPQQGERERKIVAAALRSPKGQLTLWVVNETHRDAEAAILFRDLQSRIVLHRYAMTRSERDRPDVSIQPGHGFAIGEGAHEIRDRVPAMSIAVYSTYRLGAGDPGVFAE